MKIKSFSINVKAIASSTQLILFFKILAKMADVYIRPSFPSSRQHNCLQSVCVAFKGRYEKDGAALRWGLPACVFLLRLAEREGFSFHRGVWACPQPILPSCFLLSLSSFPQVIKGLGERDVERTSAVSTHRTGSESSTQGYIHVTNLIKPNRGAKPGPRVTLRNLLSHSKAKLEKTQFHLPHHKPKSS